MSGYPIYEGQNIISYPPNTFYTMKKIIITLSGILVFCGLGTAYALGFSQIFNLNAPNTPIDTPLEQEFQINGTNLLTIHAVSDGGINIKEKEVRVTADHIVAGAGVVVPSSSGLNGDGNFYVQDGDTYLNGRLNQNQVQIFSAPRLVLGRANHNVVVLTEKIETISTVDALGHDWRGGSRVTLRFKEENEIIHLGQLDPNDVNQVQIKLKGGQSQKFSAGEVIELVLDIDILTGEKFWYEF